MNMREDWSPDGSPFSPFADGNIRYLDVRTQNYKKVPRLSLYKYFNSKEGEVTRSNQ